MLIALIHANSPLSAGPESRGTGRIAFGFGESGDLRPGQLGVMDGDGRNRRALPIDHVNAASWSPDGRAVALQLLELAARPDVYKPGIWRMNIDGAGKTRHLVRNAHSPAWSPNGTSIAFARGRDIWLFDVSARRQRRILRHGHSPGWSPDSRKLTFERGRGRTDVWVLDLATRKARRLVRNGHAADWSPDGRQIVFERCRMRAAGFDCFIYVMRPDGTGERRLFEGSEPLWSPTGREIAFIGGDERRHFNDAIISRRVDGSGRRVLFGRAAYCGCYLLDWSRRGGSRR